MSCFATCGHGIASRKRLSIHYRRTSWLRSSTAESTEFDEIYIEPEANPPIVFDGKADDVFEAIIKKKYRAIPFFDPQLVAAWRFYVISDGPLPRRPGPRRLLQGRTH